MSTPHLHVIANAQVWMETEGLDQLRRVASLPGCRCAVGMPDLHPGRGIPIGAAFAFDGVIRPALVGGDAGCGALVVPVTRAKHRGDALLRRVLVHCEGPALPDADPAALFEAAWTRGPAGLVAVSGVPDSLLELLEALAEGPWGADMLPDSGVLPNAEGNAMGNTVGNTEGNTVGNTVGNAVGHAAQLGTAGGGNHFVEISRVAEVVDREHATALGLGREALAVVAHSGSRHLGSRVAERWHNAELTEPAQQAEYLADLAGCCRYARTNRLILAWRMIAALGATRASALGSAFDLVHNGVTREQALGSEAFVHRKGCAPAHAGRPTVVLGSRGTPSWVMRGLGEPTALSSVAHGAGRRMSRGDAVQKLKGRYHRAELTRTALGGTVICDEAELLYAEHPDAYKAIEPVIASLEAAGAAQRVAALIPVINLKR